MQQVELWEIKVTQGLNDSQKAQLFCKAIFAVEERTLKTLSSVTLEVVLDRALHQCKKKYAFMSLVKIESKGLNFNELLNSEHFRNPTENLVEALRSLLIEILTVLGNITGGILSGSLYNELNKVQHDPTSDSLSRIHSGRRKSENS